MHQAVALLFAFFFVRVCAVLGVFRRRFASLSASDASEEGEGPKNKRLLPRRRTEIRVICMFFPLEETLS